MTNRLATLAAGAALAAFVAHAAPAGAQALAAPDSAVVVAGPVAEWASVAARSTAPEREARPFTPAVVGTRAAGKLGDNARYMVVGGVAFLAGAVIGGNVGTVIMVGGAGVGIYGLYRYLDTPASAEIARRQESDAAR